MQYLFQLYQASTLDSTMAGSLGFDDKILGEKTNYYCSSDEEEDGNDSGAENSDTESKGAAPEPTFIPEPEITDYKGYCTNVRKFYCLINDPFYVQIVICAPCDQYIVNFFLNIRFKNLGYCECFLCVLNIS